MIKSYVHQSIKFAEKILEKDRKGLSIDCIAAIHLYTMGWSIKESSLYYILNNELRSSKRDNIKIYFPLIRLIIEGMNKLDIYKKSIWRGINLNVSKLYKKDDEIIWWSFSSCTKDAGILKSSSFLGQKGPRTLFKIDGHNGVQITNFSSFKNEDEVLLYPGTILKVNGILDVGNDLIIIDLNVDYISPKMIDIPQSKFY